MNRLLAACRILVAIAALAMTAPIAVSANNPAPDARLQAQAMNHHQPQHGSTGVASRAPVPHQAMHSNLLHCCSEAPVQSDCAAMAGCQLHLMPGDGLIDIVSRETAPITGRLVYRDEFSAIPATPPPRALI